MPLCNLTHLDCDVIGQITDYLEHRERVLEHILEWKFARGSGKRLNVI